MTSLKADQSPSGQVLVGQLDADDAQPLVVRSGGLPKRTFTVREVVPRVALILILILCGAALATTGPSLASFVESRENAARFFRRVGAITFPSVSEIIDLTTVTLGVVLCGTLLATVFAIPVAYISAAPTSPGPVWRAVGRAITVLTRAVPDVVLAMMFALIFSLGTLPGIVAIGIHSIGMIGKMFADAIEEADSRPSEALRAGGATALQRFVSAILPQVIPSWIAVMLHRFDINLRGSVILGVVGVAGLGKAMMSAFNMLNYSLGIGIALVMLILCLVVELISTWIRSLLLPSSGRSKVSRRRGEDERLSADAIAVPSDVASRPKGYVDSIHSPSAKEQTVLPSRPWDRPRVLRLIAGWIAVGLSVAAVVVCDIQWRDLFDVWGKLPELVLMTWPPSPGPYGWTRLLAAMWQTITIAAGATLAGMLASLLLGPLAARGIAPGRATRPIFRGVLLVIRALPELVVAIVLIVITGLGPEAGCAALAFCGVGLAGKLVADSLEDLDRGPVTALQAGGATWWQRHTAATWIQARRAVIAHSLYLLDTNIRAATVLGIVGGGGIGYYLLNAAQGSNYDQVAANLMMIVVTVLLIEALSMWLRRAFR